MRNGDSACAVAAEDDAEGMADGADEDPQARFAFTRTRVAPKGEQFLAGPVSIADADVQVHLLGWAGSGHRGRTQAAPCWKASWSWPGPEPMTTPAGLVSVDRLWRVDDVGCLP